MMKRMKRMNLMVMMLWKKVGIKKIMGVKKRRSRRTFTGLSLNWKKEGG